MKYLLILAAAIGLAGCEERFRYPCQDPKNWGKEECKAPMCKATMTCPDMLTKPEEEKK